MMCLLVHIFILGTEGEDQNHSLQNKQLQYDTRARARAHTHTHTHSQDIILPLTQSSAQALLQQA